MGTVLVDFKSGKMNYGLKISVLLLVFSNVSFAAHSEKDSRVATTSRAHQKVESVQLSIRQQLNCSEKGAYIKLYSNKGDQNCETESKDFSEKTLSDDKHVLTWTGKTLGNCSNLSFDWKNDEINFDLEYFNSTNNSDICPQVLTIKFKNNSRSGGSPVYSNSHELNNRLNPNNCGGLPEAKKLKDSCGKDKECVPAHSCPFAVYLNDTFHNHEDPEERKRAGEELAESRCYNETYPNIITACTPCDSVSNKSVASVDLPYKFQKARRFSYWLSGPIRIVLSILGSIGNILSLIVFTRPSMMTKEINYILTAL